MHRVYRAWLCRSDRRFYDQFGAFPEPRLLRGGREPFRSWSAKSKVGPWFVVLSSGERPRDDGRLVGVNCEFLASVNACSDCQRGVGSAGEPMDVEVRGV